MIWFWWHKRTNKINVILNTFSYYLFSYNSIEKNIKFNNNSFQMIWLICLFFCHKKPVFLFKNMLNLANNMRSPNYLPILFWIHSLFIKPLFKVIQQKYSVIVWKSTQKFIFVDNLYSFLKNLLLTFQLFRLWWDMLFLKHIFWYIKLRKSFESFNGKRTKLTNWRNWLRQHHLVFFVI